MHIKLKGRNMDEQFKDFLQTVLDKTDEDKMAIVADALVPLSSELLKTYDTQHASDVIAALLATGIYADGKITYNEHRFINIFYKKTGVDFDEKKLFSSLTGIIFDGSAYKIIQDALDRMSDEARGHIIVILAAVCSVDDELAPEERRLIEDIYSYKKIYSGGTSKSSAAENNIDAVFESTLSYITTLSREDKISAGQNAIETILSELKDRKQLSGAVSSILDVFAVSAAADGYFFDEEYEFISYLLKSWTDQEFKKEDITRSMMEKVYSQNAYDNITSLSGRLSEEGRYALFVLISVICAIDDRINIDEIRLLQDVYYRKQD